MNLGRGDVVVATDPFKDDSEGRPFLVVNRSGAPFHGVQFIAPIAALTGSYARHIDPVLNPVGQVAF